MRVLVTGATGFLGSHLCKKLIDEGLELIITSRSQSDLSDLEGLKFEQVTADVTNLESLLRYTKNIDSVFHLAGLVGYSRAQRSSMENVNVIGTKNVVEACIKNKVRRLVHMSSVVAVGASFDGKNPLNETSEYNITHLNLGYFETKRQAELLVKKAVTDRNLDAVILNPSTIYGPGDAKKGSRKTQLKVAQGKFPFYTSGGANVVNVHDVVEATVNAWKIGKTGERYILCSENVTIKQLFELIAAEAGVEPPRIHLPNFVVHALGHVGDLLENIGKKGPINSENAWTSTLYHWFDSSKAQKEIGLKLTPAKASIAESVSWIKEHGLLK